MLINLKFFKNSSIVLPIHYNHIVQAFIYNVIDSKLADFLHNEGFGEGRKFKMFTFSKLQGRFDMKSKIGCIIFDKEVVLTVSSPYGTFCQSFANGVIKNRILLGENELEITEAELFPVEVNDDEIVVETLSPIVVYSTLTKHDGSKYTVYFAPEEKEFEEQINQNLHHKYESFVKESDRNIELTEGRIKIKPLSRTKQHIINYKDFIIKGYSGVFKLNGPKELLKLGLEAGLGAKNSMGFGCVRRVEGKILKK